MKKFAIIITVVFLSLAALVFAYFGYSVIGNVDGNTYIVPGIHFALTGKLVNPIVSDTVLAGDPSGQWRFLYYPPLFPLFLSLFIFPASSIPIPVQVFIFIALVNSVVIALSALALYRVTIKYGKQLNWTEVVIIGLTLFVLFRFSKSFGGRPETLVRLFVTLGFVLFLYLRRSWHLVLALGVLLGFTAATHPFAQMLFFSLVGLAFSTKYDFWASLKHLVFVLVVGIATYALIFLWSPFSVADTVAGVYRHASLTLLGIDYAGVLFSLKKPEILAFGAVIAALIFFGFRMVFGLLKGGKVAAPFLFVIFTIAFFALTAFTLLVGRKHYIIPFFLLVFAGFLYYIIYSRGSKPIQRFLVAIFAAFFILSLKTIFLFPFFMKDGISLAAARGAFREILSSYPEDTVVRFDGPHLWALTEKMHEHEPAKSTRRKPPLFVEPAEPFRFAIPDHLRIKEPETLSQTQQPLDLCVLKRGFYATTTPKIFGIEINPIMPGYNFLVYECRTEPISKIPPPAI